MVRRPLVFDYESIQLRTASPKDFAFRNSAKSIYCYLRSFLMRFSLFLFNPVIFLCKLIEVHDIISNTKFIVEYLP